MTAVIGTAGHIDHGKTALLHALTGIDADRLPEEQRRGMTIDVGYAHLDLPDGDSIDFVDVPGHDRLVGNMLVGAGEIDAALVVVAADDGPRAQTMEHLELLDGLRIRDGVVVVTKLDLVDAERRAEVETLVRGLIDRTSLAGATVLAASSVSGVGLDEVRAAMLAVRARVERAGRVQAGSGLRLAIDRVFGVRGRGVVVTGTLRGGWIARGDVLRLEPGGGTTRVREVQVHGGMVERAGPGRAALNLAGINARQLERGAILTTDPAVVGTDRLLVALSPAAALGGGPVPLPNDRASLRLHVGTAQVGATVGRAGSVSAALPSGEATALLRLDHPVAVAAGDVFVLRRPSPPRTEAGGRILDPMPPRGASRRRLNADRLAALAAATDAGSWAAARIDLHGAAPARGGLELAADVAGDLAERAVALVRAAHAAAPDRPALAGATLRTELASALRRSVTVDPTAAALAAGRTIDDLVRRGRLERIAGGVRDPGHAVAQSPAVDAAMDRLCALLDVAAPPPLAEAARAARCPPAALRSLEAAGRIIRVDTDLAWATPAWDRLARTALELAANGPLTPAALRDATGTSRKYVMALLEDLDRRAILRRTPAGHLAGPRAGQLGEALLQGAGAGDGRP